MACVTKAGRLLAVASVCFLCFYKLAGKIPYILPKGAQPINNSLEK